MPGAMRELWVEETEVRLYGDGAEDDRPLLLWAGDRLTPWSDEAAEERLVRELASLSGWSIAVVRYAPGDVETFPGPLTRVYRCLLHFQARARRGAPVAVGGNGFGAGLAAATSILGGRYGDEPVAARVLLAPLLDARLASPSWRRLGGANDRRRTKAALAAYAPGVDSADPLLSPLLAEDLGGLPATVIVTAWDDPMRDDGERYAGRLRSAGVRVLGHRYPGTSHFQACGGGGSEQGAEVVAGLASAMSLLLSRSSQLGDRSSSS